MSRHPGMQRLRAWLGGHVRQGRHVLPVRVGGTVTATGSTPQPCWVLTSRWCGWWWRCWPGGWSWCIRPRSPCRTTPSFAKLRATPTSWCATRCGWHGVCGGAAGVPGAHGTWERWHPGCSWSPGAAGGGADPACGQGGQRCAALDRAGHHELPALGAGQVRRAAVRGRLHGAQDGGEGALLSRRAAHGRVPWPWWACCCWPSPTWAPSW
jgi:hypothetical protein